MFNSYAAAAAGDEVLARTIIDGVKRVAASGRYMNESEMLTMAQAKRFGLCYRNGPSTPCPQHLPRFVGRMYTNLLISMAVLDSSMTDDDRAVIVPWIERGYKTFVAPELAGDPSGIYDFANYGMARLALAAVTDDMGLANLELNARRRDFIKHIESSGYIDENSYRGERAFWYHTAGLDPALSYALIAREWGVDFFKDPTLGPRLRAAVDKTVLGLSDYAAFRSVGNRGDAYTTDPRDRIADVHQFALNLIPIAAREYGVRITPGARYRNLSRLEAYTQTSGFSARCYYSGR
ncbi:alginate lyase family protein [Boseongicola aestuarii]|uniref:alginate lyase family protein n=1 Tax=Boseongicola aestuarii TaxID=1470561 RepID=UPI001594EB52|nr:alginate lyase family protein [Boseongicola aestuarii]